MEVKSDVAGLKCEVSCSAEVAQFTGGDEVLRLTNRFIETVAERIDVVEIALPSTQVTTVRSIECSVVRYHSVILKQQHQ